MRLGAFRVYAPGSCRSRSFSISKSTGFVMNSAAPYSSHVLARRAKLRLCKASFNPFKITQQALRDQPHERKCESWRLMKGDDDRILVDTVHLDIAQTDGGGSVRRQSF